MQRPDPVDSDRKWTSEAVLEAILKRHRAGLPMFASALRGAAGHIENTDTSLFWGATNLLGGWREAVASRVPCSIQARYAAR